MNIQGISSHAPVLAAAQTNSAAKNGSAGTGATSNSNSAEQTFMELLATELRAQDPTSPMDPTAMVGQMFQMNQLQQLIDINQTLSAALGGSAPSAVASRLHATAPSHAAASYLQQSPIGAN
jgi:flagellar hook assembly protein FlgD